DYALVGENPARERRHDGPPARLCATDERKAPEGTARANSSPWGVPERSHLSARVRHLYDGCRGKDVTVNAIDWQTEEFERPRPPLRAVAYRMLGSLSDADAIVQEAWLRLTRSDAAS